MALTEKVPGLVEVVDAPAPTKASTTLDTSAVKLPTSTAEEDRHSASQRAINQTWESTQQMIALAVTAASLAVACWLAVMGSTESVQTAALVFVFGVANLVIGFYFGRTNHERIGGVTLGR